jgi:hypothetical protein
MITLGHLFVIHVQVLCAGRTGRSIPNVRNLYTLFKLIQRYTFLLCLIFEFPIDIKVEKIKETFSFLS